MRLIQLLPLLLLLSLNPGCNHRLPNVKAAEIHVRTSLLGVFNSTADATGVSVTDVNITAQEAGWRVTILGFDHTTVTKGYQQRRDKD